MKRDVRRYLTAGRTMYGELVGTFVYEAMNELCLDVYEGRISAARPVMFSAQPGRYADRRAWALYLPGDNGRPGTITLHRGLAWHEDRGEWLEVTKIEALRSLVPPPMVFSMRSIPLVAAPTTPPTGSRH